MENSKKILKMAFDALEDKKGEDVQILEITEITMLADYFIITNGNNPSQIQSLVDNVEEALEKEGMFTKRVEGKKDSGWVLMDYGDIVVHIFSKEDREFYDLERIWKDGKNITEEIKAYA